MWKAIVAADENGVIGAAGGIPWHLPEDFKWFKSCTQGHIVLMGRKTYESLPKKPLPGRENWILSRTLSEGESPDGVRRFDCVESALMASKGDPRIVWVCGGAHVYRECLPLCSEVYLTRVKRKVPNGDTFLPSFEQDFLEPQQLKDEAAFSIFKFVRKPAIH